MGLMEAVERSGVMLDEATDALEAIFNIVNDGEWIAGESPVLDAVHLELMKYYFKPRKD